MATTAVSYFKRYKMEADLRDLPPPALPPGFHWLPWSDEHARRPTPRCCTTASTRKSTR